MKYIRYAFNGEEELYDVATDPFETTNLAADPSFAAVKAATSQRWISCWPRVRSIRRSSPARRGRSTCVTSGSRTSRRRARRPTPVGSPTTVSRDRGWTAPAGCGPREASPTASTRSRSLRPTKPDRRTPRRPPARSAWGRDRRSTSSRDQLPRARAGTRRSRSRAEPGASFVCRLVKVGLIPGMDRVRSEHGVLGLRALDDGDWSFQVRATDPATSITSNRPSSWVFRVDNLAPRLMLQARPPLATRSGQATVAFARAIGTRRRGSDMHGGRSGGRLRPRFVHPGRVRFGSACPQRRPPGCRGQRVHGHHRVDRRSNVARGDDPEGAAPSFENEPAPFFTMGVHTGR